MSLKNTLSSHDEQMMELVLHFLSRPQACAIWDGRIEKEHFPHAPPLTFYLVLGPSTKKKPPPRFQVANDNPISTIIMMGTYLLSLTM